MNLTSVLPIFPGFKPGQSWTAPGVPARAPGWRFKETDKWNNSSNQAINGRMSVVKYWLNPLWDWEWNYGYLKDNPTDLNPFYPLPIPATDLGVLRGFHGAMQGRGNQFLYQPPDSSIGGTMSITAVGPAGVANLWNLYGTNNASLGQLASISGLSGADWLNGENLTVLAGGATFGYITVYFAHAAYPFTADSGTAFCGQVLAAVDSNNSCELLHTYGAYPTMPLTGTPPAFTLTTESVQVIDQDSLRVMANGGSSPGYTLLPADSYAPYQGLVLQFDETPTAPVTYSANFYYACRFSDDSMNWENFQTMLYLCSKFDFEQDRL